MPNAPLIAVTGATGTVGGHVVERLVASGIRPRLVVRDPSRLPADAPDDVRRASRYGAYDEMVAALEGVAVLLLIPAAESADRVAQHRTAVDAAAAAGVERIVYVSFLGAAPEATFTLARDHSATEAHIRSSGVPFSFLRMSLYLDFIPGMVGADGVIRGPAGNGRVAPILRDDVAAAAVAVLRSEGHDGRSYDLTGSEAFTLAEAAERMAARSGKPIRFHDESDEEALASRASYGAPEWEVRGWISSYEAIRDGSLSTVSNDFRRLVGRDPVGLDAYLAAHPEALDHVTARPDA